MHRWRTISRNTTFITKTTHRLNGAPPHRTQQGFIFATNAPGPFRGAKSGRSIVRRSYRQAQHLRRRHGITDHAVAISAIKIAYALTITHPSNPTSSSSAFDHSTKTAMTLFITICLYLSLTLLVSSTPLQPLTLTAPSPLPDADTYTNTTVTATAKAHCFIQPHHVGAPTLHDASPHDCRVALARLPNGKPPNVPYTFGRQAGADVRLPHAQAVRTCKIIIDIADEGETERLTWWEIEQTLEAPRGVLKNCLGRGFRPPLGGRMAVGGKGVMQAIVVGQAGGAVV